MKKFNNYVMQAEVFLAENPLVTMVLYFMGFATSGFVTYLALSAPSISFASKSVWASYTIIMEFGKAINYLQWVKINIKKKVYRTIWLILTFFSIAASMTFMIIESNVTENRAKNSGIYLAQTKTKEANLLDDLKQAKVEKDQALAEKNQAISSLSNEKEEIAKQINDDNKTIKSLQSQIADESASLQHYIAKGFLDRKSASENRISQLKASIDKTIVHRDNLKVNDKISEVDKKINTADEKIKAKEAEINGIDYSSLPQEKATAGYYALFQFFGINQGIIFWIEFIFTLSITTTFEVLICMLYSISKTGHFPTLLNPEPEKKKKPDIDIPDKKNDSPTLSDKKGNPGPVTSRDNNEIVMREKDEKVMRETPNSSQVSSQENTENPLSYEQDISPLTGPHRNIGKKEEKLNEFDIKKYIKYAKEIIKKEGRFPSIVESSQALKFSEWKCRKIHKKLKDKGMIETGRLNGINSTWFSDNKKSSAV